MKPTISFAILLSAFAMTASHFANAAPGRPIKPAKEVFEAIAGKSKIPGQEFSKSDQKKLESAFKAEFARLNLSAFEVAPRPNPAAAEAANTGVVKILGRLQSLDKVEPANLGVALAIIKLSERYVAQEAGVTLPANLRAQAQASILKLIEKADSFIEMAPEKRALWEKVILQAVDRWRTGVPLSEAVIGALASQKGVNITTREGQRQMRELLDAFAKCE